MDKMTDSLMDKEKQIEKNNIIIKLLELSILELNKTQTEYRTGFRAGLAKAISIIETGEKNE